MARRSKGPWRRKQTGAWYTKVNGKQVKLAKANESLDIAWKRYHEVHANSERVQHLPTTIAALLDEYLEWVKHNRSPRTYK